MSGDLDALGYVPRTSTYRPPPTEKRRSAEYVLPDSVVHRALWEQMQRQRVQATTVDGVKDRFADSPVLGQVAIMPKDERVAKYNKPYGLVDQRPGEDALIIFSNLSEHWEQLKERADEARHYGWTKRERTSDPPDVQQLWTDYVLKQEDKRHGRIRVGYGHRGVTEYRNG